MNDIKPTTSQSRVTNQSGSPVTDQQLLEAIYISVEKTRKYIFWMNVVTIAFVVIPILIGAIATPFLIKGFGSYLGALQGG